MLAHIGVYTEASNYHILFTSYIGRDFLPIHKVVNIVLKKHQRVLDILWVSIVKIKYVIIKSINAAFTDFDSMKTPCSQQTKA